MMGIYLGLILGAALTCFALAHLWDKAERADAKAERAIHALSERVGTPPPAGRGDGPYATAEDLDELRQWRREWACSLGEACDAIDGLRAADGYRAAEARAVEARLQALRDALALRPTADDLDALARRADARLALIESRIAPRGDLLEAADGLRLLGDLLELAAGPDPTLVGRIAVADTGEFHPDDPATEASVP